MALRRAITDEMERNSSVFIMGEDIGKYGGCFGVTNGLLKQFGEDRVRDTPISENTIVGIAVGSAILGMRPIVEIMFMDFITLAMDQIVNHAAKFHYMFGGQVNVPMVIRTAFGAGRGYGATHSQSLESMLLGIPGIKVIAPAFPQDAYDMLKWAINDDNPVVFLEHKLLYGYLDYWDSEQKNIDQPKANVIRQGNDITVIAYSRMVHEAIEASNILSNSGVSLEVIDLRSLCPLDINTIVDSVCKTGHVIIAEEGVSQWGVNGEITFQIMENCLSKLQAPVKRIGLPAVPIPCSYKLERMVLPGAHNIVELSLKLLKSTTTN